MLLEIGRQKGVWRRFPTYGRILAASRRRYDVKRKRETRSAPPWPECSEDRNLNRLLNPCQGGRLLFDILVVNEFERAVLDLKKADCVWGPVHSSIGQEATAVGTVHALRKTDKVLGTHRSHHHFLSKVMRHVLDDSWNPANETLPPEGENVLRRALAEIMGLAPGYCGGRGGSMHLRCAEAGFLGSNAIVGGGVPIATGVAFAEKRNETGNLVVSFLGDGAVNQGAFHEACNFAAIWNLPIIFFIENNLYAVATRIDTVCAVNDLADRARGYGMESCVVDGTDVVEVLAAIGNVAERIRAGGPPWLVEAKCYRRYHHAGDLPGSAFKYRSLEEESTWAKREAVECFPKSLVEAGLLKTGDVKRIQLLAKDAVSKAVECCTLPGPPRKVRAELWPAPETAREGLRSSGREWEGVSFNEAGDFRDFEELKYSDAIAAVTGRWLERDPKVFIAGEEVANFGGGAYGATKDLAAKFPDRVLNTPISEAGMTGLALGAAMSGMIPVIEIMFPDFALVAADQLFNQIGKARHMYGDTTELPLVVRTRIAAGCGYGGQHSMDPVGLYALFPGWRMAAPADAFDYVGLFNSAMRSLDPVVILEHHALYSRRFPVPSGNLDYCVPFGKARRVAPGNDVTLVTYGFMVSRCQALLPRWNEEGTSVEIIDLRTLDCLGIDYELIGESVKKTGAMIVVEEAPKSFSLGARVASEVTERFFDYLDGPIARLASVDVPLPVSRVLEAEALLKDSDILSTTTAVARRAWK